MYMTYQNVLNNKPYMIASLVGEKNKILLCRIILTYQKPLKKNNCGFRNLKPWVYEIHLEVWYLVY